MSLNKAFCIAVLGVLEVSRFLLLLAPIFVRRIGRGRLKHVSPGVRRILAQTLGNFADVGFRSRFLAAQPVHRRQRRVNLRLASAAPPHAAAERQQCDMLPAVWDLVFDGRRRPVPVTVFLASGQRDQPFWKWRNRRFIGTRRAFPTVPSSANVHAWSQHDIAASAFRSRPSPSSPIMFFSPARCANKRWLPPPPVRDVTVVGSSPYLRSSCQRVSFPKWRASTSRTSTPDGSPQASATLASGHLFHHARITAGSPLASLTPCGVRGCLPA